jgi:hypothetical protein
MKVFTRMLWEHLWIFILFYVTPHIREQNIPSSIRMKKINAYCLKRIKILGEMLNELDATEL